MAATFVRERLGIALALAVPIFPIGNFSSGAALLYTALAATLLAVMWREPRATLLFAFGPLLAPLSAVALLPLATVRIGSGARRALVTALGVLTAAVVAGIDHGTLPLVGGAAPLGTGLRGAAGVLGVAGSLAHDRRRAPGSPPRDGPPHRRRRCAAPRRRQRAPLERRARRGDARGDASRPARRCAVLALRRARGVFHRRGGVFGACRVLARRYIPARC